MTGYVFAGAFFAVIAMIYPKGMGGGDGVMAAGLGTWLGAGHVWAMIGMAFGLGALGALPLMAVGRLNRKSFIPFGPYLSVSAFLLWMFPGAPDAFWTWVFPNP